MDLDTCPNPRPHPVAQASANGCGPGALTNLIPQTYGYARDYSACDNHDRRYNKCNQPKADYDEKFHADLYKQCRDPFAGNANNADLNTCYARARLYYN